MVDLSEESGTGGVEVGLEAGVVLSEGGLLVGEEGVELAGLVGDGVLEGSGGIVSEDGDLLWGFSSNLGCNCFDS